MFRSVFLKQKAIDSTCQLLAGATGEFTVSWLKHNKRVRLELVDLATQAPKKDVDSLFISALLFAPVSIFSLAVSC